MGATPKSVCFLMSQVLRKGPVLNWDEQGQGWGGKIRDRDRTGRHTGTLYGHGPGQRTRPCGSQSLPHRTLLHPAGAQRWPFTPCPRGTSHQQGEDRVPGIMKERSPREHCQPKVPPQNGTQESGTSHSYGTWLFEREALEGQRVQGEVFSELPSCA